LSFSPTLRDRCVFFRALTLRLFFFDGTLDFFLFLAATNLRFFRAIQKSPRGSLDFVHSIER
jgi:hypothetical protein